MKTLLVFVPIVTAILSSPCMAQQQAANPTNRPVSHHEVRKGDDNRNLRISFKMKAQDVEGSGNFTVLNRSQGNYVVGSEVPVETEVDKAKRVNWVKASVIANCAPVALSEDLFSVTCQFELSGPSTNGPQYPRTPVSLQLQSEFVIRKGRTLVLVDEPTRRIEVALNEVPL